MDIDELRSSLEQLEKENRILKKKLSRSEQNRIQLEDTQQKNDALMRRTILELRQAQQTIENTNTELEQRVEQRTTELEKANKALQLQVADRTRAENRLLELNHQLITAHDRALEANHAKSNFLARMSHELRTPLNAIIGYTELVQEDITEFVPTQQLNDLQHILDSGHHLLRLIDDILDLSKIEAGKMALHYETFDAAEFAQHIIQIFSPLTRKSGNKLTLECSSSIGKLETDRTKLRQSLLNLLSNANKFTHAGNIKLVLQRHTINGIPHITFSIHDTGIGIPPEEQQHIFEAFRQKDDSPTRKYGGTGLGLAISQNLCRMLGGEISVKSQPGEGSTFTFELPTSPQSLIPLHTPLPNQNIDP